MSDKPSYLKLLNAVSLAETAAHEYLECWIAVTPSDDVRGVLQAVSVREGEHGKAFAKRINELGYNLRPREDPGAADRMALAASTELTDLQKMEKLGLGRLDSGDKPDVFDTFFNDHSIDIRTGELLGRYICEERDSGRLLKSCYEQLKAAAGGGSSVAPARLDALEAKVDQVCMAVTQLTELIASQAAPRAGSNGGTNGKAKRKVSA